MYRGTELYNRMSPYDAFYIVEDWNGEGFSKEETLTAWQYIWDKGFHLTMPGFYGRTAIDLVENGDIEA